MRRVKRWRFYCDFCKKSGASGGAMAKHELHCCRNPARVCRMCIAAGDCVQATMADLIEAVETGGLEAVTVVAQSCPACILAALMQERTKNGSHPETFIEFDYKAASVSFWNDIDAKRGTEHDAFVATQWAGWR